MYAVESGSRAWGFASPDSDYDIRFIFIRSAESYVSVQEGLESIDLPLEGELESEEKMRGDLRAKHGVDPLDIEGMIGVKVPRP